MNVRQNSKITTDEHGFGLINNLGLCKNKNFATEAQRHGEFIEFFSKILNKLPAYPHNLAITSNMLLTSVTRCLCGISFYKCSIRLSHTEFVEQTSHDGTVRNDGNPKSNMTFDKLQKFYFF